MGPLWEATRDLHHKAEGHPVSQRMSSGTVGPQEWADWLYALWIIHSALDPHLPLYVRRADALMQDLLELLPVQPHSSVAAVRFTETLVTADAIFGAAYITIGAHKRGGKVIEKALREAGSGLPSHHTHFDAGQEAELFVKRMRDIPEIAQGARRAFQALHDILDEIEGRGNAGS
jgi:heme oxygenase